MTDADSARTALVSAIASVELLDAAPDAWMIVDVDGRIQAYNTNAPVLFGHDPAAFGGLTIDQLVPSDRRADHAKLRDGYFAAPETRTMGFGLDLEAVRADGSTFPVDVSLSPIDVFGQAHVIAAVRDITESVDLRSEMTRLTRESALIEERERVARDLHDTVIQEIFAVGLTLQAVTSRADDEFVRERLHQAIDDLDRVIRDIRTAIFGLTNHQNWGRGLQGEILRIATEEAYALGFEPAIDFAGDVEAIDTAVADHLLPTLREALSNVARHANARRCDIVLGLEDGHVELMVTDDGVGPNESHGDALSGRGLPNMISRATELGGSCLFEAVDGGGARLTWRVPGVTCP